MLMCDVLCFFLHCVVTVPFDCVMLKLGFQSSIDTNESTKEANWRTPVSLPFFELHSWTYLEERFNDRNKRLKYWEKVLSTHWPHIPKCLIWKRNYFNGFVSELNLFFFCLFVNCNNFTCVCIHFIKFRLFVILFYKNIVVMLLTHYWITRGIIPDLSLAQVSDEEEKASSCRVDDFFRNYSTLLLLN